MYVMALPFLACQVADAGSLNGTLLNGTRISIAGRRRGAAYRLNSDDLLQLGTSTAIKVPSGCPCTAASATKGPGNYCLCCSQSIHLGKVHPCGRILPAVRRCTVVVRSCICN